MTQRSAWLTAITLITLAVAVGPTMCAPTAVALPSDAADKYLGVWNYDQPDRHSMANIATINFAGYPVTIPQIGTITFTRDGDSGVRGHTDQGCTWHFTVEPDALDLTSTTQYCFNHVIGSGYNIDRWHVTVHGNQEQESLHANSYLAFGSIPFGLVDGRRTNAQVGSPSDTAHRFDGSWTYDQPDLLSLTNVATTPSFLPVAPAPGPTFGAVTFSSGTGDTLSAHTDNGCTWTMAAHGNTAELSPANQTCVRPNGATSLSFWSMATNGQHQASVMTGTDNGRPFVLNVGALTRS